MLEKFKISLRLNILTLFTLLLITVGIVISAIDYYTTQRILLVTGKKIVQQTSYMTEQFVMQLFYPGFYLTNLGADLIRRKLVIPGPTKEFTRYLLETIIALPNNLIIAWGEPSGNYYELERSHSNTFLNTIITCQQQICTAQLKYIDAENNDISETKISSWDQTNNKQISGTFKPYDPRVRPWYQQAIAKHQPIVSDVFLSILFSGSTVLCMNSANPVYAKNGRLQGVFSAKTSLVTLSQYIANIDLTKHSVIFIIDNKGNLIAAKNLQDFSSAILPKIDALNLPWVNQSLRYYQQNHETLFTYTYNKTKYVAFYHTIPGLRKTQLDIGIVIPSSDIVGFLEQQLVYSLLAMLVILGISALLVWLISRSISKPIIQLADEVKQVTYSPSLPESHIKSQIIEINYMQDAFNAMKHSLKSFGRYVPFTLVKQLLAKSTVPHVGGENKNLTCLFTDIQGFTTLAEKLSPPQLMTYLSEYFDIMTKIILQNMGTVDKYIGDSIMAFWGAPVDDSKHAFNACTAALQMDAALTKLNQAWNAKGEPQLIVRIGINTGTMIVGNVGSEDRLNYTILGDNVTLANIAEGINKLFGTRIIITENTYQLVKNDFTCRSLDFFLLHGTHQGVNIYELLPKENSANNISNHAIAPLQGTIL